MSGKQIKERLERDLGFEANRARLLTEAAASIEISTCWERKGLSKLDEKTYSALAKAALVSGLAGRQKLSDMIIKVATSNSKNVDLTEVDLAISALVLEHQKTLHWDGDQMSASSLRGRIEFVRMVSPETGDLLAERYRLASSSPASNKKSDK
jgi:hypothetical protein